MATVSGDGWRRSSFCSQDSCIEVRKLRSGAIEVRAGKYQGMIATSAEWEAFVAGIKAGDFDDLAGPS